MGFTWQEIYSDPVVAELNFKIESDEWGNIILSPPPGAAHSDFQAVIIEWLNRSLTGGRAQPEYPLQTSKGVKGIDVVWVSSDRRKQNPKGSLVHLIAPEICVEALSPKNTRAEISQKIRLYFEKGARECWICDRKGNMSFSDPTGRIPRSRLCPKFPVKIERD